MKPKPLLQKINPRLIIIHAIAMWMFIYAFMLFASLYYLPVTMAIMHPKTNSETWKSLEKQGFNPYISYYVTFFFFVPFVGLFGGFLLSLVVSLFRKWFWLNSVVAFIFIFVLYRFDLSGWKWLKIVFLAPGRLLRLNLFFFLAVNASLLFMIGLLLFFLKPVNRFIRDAAVPEKRIA